MRRGLLPVVTLAAVVGALAAVVVEAAPARAAGELQLSSDGSHWGAAIARPLFDPQVSWVPGDVRTSTFFVRSSNVDQGDLTVDVLPGQQDALHDTGFLTIETRAAGGDWTSIDAGRTRRLVAADEVEGGRAVPVDMRVRLDPQATDQTMALASDLDLRVTVSQTDSAAAGAGPTTRFPLVPWMALLGLLPLGAGAFAATRRATRHRSSTPSHDGTPA